eukprot:7706044-Pyramimonas_sp.AAC.1
MGGLTRHSEPLVAANGEAEDAVEDARAAPSRAPGNPSEPKVEPWGARGAAVGLPWGSRGAP